MVVNSILAALYMVLVLIGLGLIGARIISFFHFFRALPYWQVLLLGFGLTPAILSLIGFSQVNAFLPIAQVICALSSIYALSNLAIRRCTVYAETKKFISTKSGMATLLFALAGICIFMSAQWCYFAGGINNLDQFRGLGFIAGFSANNLKPAHPLDLSIPISYGYYFYMYPALVYSGIKGHAWPSTLLVVSALFAIFWFYFVFLKFMELFLPKLFPSWQIFAAMAVTFYGLDFVLRVPYSSDWWNPLQITQMAAYWHWLYHYLFAAALGFSSLICLSKAFKNRRGSSALAAILFLVMTPLYSSLTGLFFAAVFFVYYLLMCVADWRRLAFWRTFNLTLSYFLVFFGAFAVLFGPQVFTFIGHKDFLVFYAAPVFWFTQQPIFSSGLNDWHLFLLTLITELGFLHCLSLCLVPALIYKIYKSKNEEAGLLCAFAVVTVLSITFISSNSHDWNWRTGNFGLIILSSIPIVWILSRLSELNHPKTFIIKITVAALFIPGAASFAYETQQRLAYCTPAGEAALAINMNVPLNSIVAYSQNAKRPSKILAIPSDHLWWHTSTTLSPKRFAMANEQELKLSLAMQAGRAAYGASNPMWKLLYVYKADDALLEKEFNWHASHSPCEGTWFGSSLPSRRYVEVDKISNKTEFRSLTCEN